MSIRVISTTLVLGSMALLSSCATSTDGISYSLFDEGLALIGAVTYPPQGENWVIEEHNPGNISFGKIGRDITQTIAGSITVTQLPEPGSDEEYCRLIEDQRWGQESSPRFEDTIIDETCARSNRVLKYTFHVTYRDTGANNLPEGERYMIVEDYGVIYQHPLKKEISIYIALSQRTKENDSYPSFQTIAEKFANDIVLNENYFDQL